MQKLLMSFYILNIDYKVFAIDYINSSLIITVYYS